MMRLLSLKNIDDKKHVVVPFKGLWLDLMGTPEKTGCWIIYGKSGQGKTRFMMKMAKELDEMKYRIIIISMEEGITRSFKDALRESGIITGLHRINVSTGASIEELDEYLEKNSRKPDMIFADSVQYWSNQYKASAGKIIELRNKYPSIVFVMTCHVSGNEVEGNDAYLVKRDSFCRIQVEGHTAFYRGRGSGGKTGKYVIWKEGAERYWLENQK